MKLALTTGVKHISQHLSSMLPVQQPHWLHYISTPDSKCKAADLLKVSKSHCCQPEPLVVLCTFIWICAHWKRSDRANPSAFLKASSGHWLAQSLWKKLLMCSWQRRNQSQKQSMLGGKPLSTLPNQLPPSYAQTKRTFDCYEISGEGN